MPFRTRPSHKTKPSIYSCDGGLGFLIVISEFGRLALNLLRQERTFRVGIKARRLSREKDMWFAQLDTIASFTFHGKSGQLTVRKEARPRGGLYWYAYDGAGEKMTKQYLGRLERGLVAARLAGRQTNIGEFLNASFF